MLTVSVTETVSSGIVETLELCMFQLGNDNSKLANLGPVLSQLNKNEILNNPISLFHNYHNK